MGGSGEEGIAVIQVRVMAACTCIMAVVIQRRWLAFIHPGPSHAESRSLCFSVSLALSNDKNKTI